MEKAEVRLLLLMALMLSVKFYDMPQSLQGATY